MLKSIDSNLPELKQLAADDKSLQKLLLDINEDLLTDIISVLEPFDQATRLVSADTVPTLHLVTAMSTTNEALGVQTSGYRGGSRTQDSTVNVHDIEISSWGFFIMWLFCWTLVLKTTEV